MNDLCSPYKRRKIPCIERNAPIFSQAMHDHDFGLAARIAFLTTLEVIGVKGIMDALDQGNKYWKRKHMEDLL